VAAPWREELEERGREIRVRRFTNTVFPSVSDAQLSGVSSMADERDAAKARKKANCLIIAFREV